MRVPEQPEKDADGQLPGEGPVVVEAIAFEDIILSEDAARHFAEVLRP